MLKIVWKSFRANIKNFLAFFISIIMAVNILFLFMYIQQAVSNIKRNVSGVFPLQTASELPQIMQTFVPPVILIAVIVIVYSVQFYIHSRLQDYGMLIILGIRKKDLKKFLIMEYVLSCSFACLGGLLVGNIISYFVGKCLEDFVGQSLIESINMLKVYEMTLLLCIVMIGAALFGVAILLEEKDLSAFMNAEVIVNKKRSSKRSILYLFGGVTFVGIGIGFVALKGEGGPEIKLAQILIYIGIFIGICFGAECLLGKRLKSVKYYKKILVWNQFNYYFSENKYMITVQTILGLLLLVFSFSIISGIFPMTRQTYLNNFVCTLNTGEDFLEEFEKEYSGNFISFPYVWVSDGSLVTTIGISLSDYNRIFGATEKLNKNEIISLLDHPQSSSMIDNKKERTTMTVHIGKNVMLQRLQKGDKKYKVKWEKYKEIIGFGVDGMAVIDDETFKDAIKQDDFYQDFLILNVGKKQLNDATKFVEKKRKEGILQEALCEKLLSESDWNDRVLLLLILAIIDLAVLFFSMFFSWLKTFSEINRIKERYRFLTITGIKTEEKIKTLNKEMALLIKIPMVLSAVIGGSICAAWGWKKCDGFLGLYNRLRSGGLYYKEIIVILIVYLAIEYLFMIGIRLWVRKEVLGERS